MKKFDREEQLIYDAFSQIDVDTDKLKQRMSAMRQKKQRLPIKFSVTAAAVFIFMALSITAYGATGGFDQFLARFNPAFGELAIPLIEPVYAENQGIRMEIYGAQQFGNAVLVYLSMQDTTGENRLSVHTTPDLEIYGDGQSLSNGAQSSQRLYFNKSTNTLYFEVRVIGDAGIPRLDNLEIVAVGIMCFDPARDRGGQVYTLASGEWRMEVYTSDTDDQVISWADISITDAHIDYMSLNPLGIQINGSHTWDINERRAIPEIEIEVENRRRNIRLNTGGGGMGSNSFDFFFHTESPLDIETVTGVIVNGVRIAVE